MGLDIRWPIGLMFTIFGAILSVHGLITYSDAKLHEQSLGMNVNLGWGLVLLAFGIFMLVSARISAKKSKEK